MERTLTVFKIRSKSTKKPKVVKTSCFYMVYEKENNGDCDMMGQKSEDELGGKKKASGR